MNNSTISQVERIISRHDPENDCRPDGPAVTWAEEALASMVIELVNEVKRLKDEID